MNPHKEYVKLIPQAKTAVLFIHGIVGTPAHFKDFIPLIPKDWSIYNTLLHGHGKRVEDFSASSMDDWKRQIHCILSELKRTHEQIIIVSHSMGTLFAIEEAVNDPEKIKYLFMIATPLRISVKPSAVLISLRILTERDRATNPKEAAAREAYGIGRNKNLWKYLPWISKYSDLLKEIRIVRKDIPRLIVPAISFQSKCDEVISRSSEVYLRGNPNIKICTLQSSGHFGFSENDNQIVLKQFESICETLKTE